MAGWEIYIYIYTSRSQSYKLVRDSELLYSHKDSHDQTKKEEKKSSKRKLKEHLASMVLSIFRHTNISIYISRKN